MNYGMMASGNGSSSILMLRWLVLCASFTFLVGCTDQNPDSESTNASSGTAFRGTASEAKQLASSQVEIRAQSGARSVATIAGDGQFVVESVSGSGPWILRTNLGNGNFRYGIAYKSAIANVHSYTDIVLRSWFLQEHDLLDLDAAFESEAPMPFYPDSEQLTARATTYFGLIDRVLPLYNLVGPQLFNDDFRADDTGIDRFLDDNPVVVDGREITLIRTAPDNNKVQSFVTLDILLDTELELPDQIPPSMPENLRALVNDSEEIILVWETSLDNVAVVGYEVLRDGRVLTITPYPVYTDKDVNSDVLYRYTVSAIDVAGNRSAPASISTSGTLRVGSVQAPPAPRALRSVRETTQRTDLIWEQDDTSAVASYNVYRGPSTNEALTLLARVTSAAMTDATISPGRAYCYQVSAVNASGIESATTDALCTVNSQIEVPPDEAPIVIDVPEFAGLTVPGDTHVAACDDIFPSYDISSELFIASGCYRVEQNIEVSNFGVLTLQPGVTLKFSPDTQILVHTRGTLVSAGTSGNPVVMTGDRPVAGWWRGVEFRHSDNSMNLISRTIIEYTGSDSNLGAIALVSSTNRPSRLRVENSLIRNSQWYGISIPGLDSHLDSFRGNLITGNGRAAQINFTALPSITDGSLFSQNDLNRLYVSSGTFNTGMVINDPGVPIQIDGINQVLDTLIINQGVKLYFTGLSPFSVRSALVIRGTADNPVLLSSSNIGRGSWQGLQLIDGANANLVNVIIENAGKGSVANPDGANLFANNARLSLDNVTLRHSSSYGFHATGMQVIIDKSSRINLVDNAREDIVSPEDF